MRVHGVHTRDAARVEAQRAVELKGVVEKRCRRCDAAKVPIRYETVKDVRVAEHLLHVRDQRRLPPPVVLVADEGVGLIEPATRGVARVR